MVYASLVLPKHADPTPTQERKFLDSVEIGPSEKQARSDRLNDALKHDQPLRFAFQALRDVLTKTGWKPDTSEGVPLLEFLGQRYGTEPANIRKSERAVQTFLGREEFYPFHSFPQVRKVLGEAGEDWFNLTHPWNGRHLNWRDVSPPTEAIGVIGYSQEPGAKLRAFAAPNWVLQAAMEGTKQCLLSALAHCEWDCTHEQSKGVLGVQKWLAEGRKVFSVDLSDATNNFPLHLQIRLLNYLGLPPEDIRLLELVSRSPFRLSWGDGRLITWTVGQPLGAGPSFMSFALGHAVIALAAEISAGVPVKDLGSHFYILGDDIVISDDSVHAAYRGYLGVLGCPVSESKCLQSLVAGEFAGKLITKDHVYHGYKYREISDISFLDVLRNLGAQALSVCTAPQKAYAELVWELPEPVGLGFNPAGRPLAERYAEFLFVIEALKQAEPDTKTLRPEELEARMRYGFKSRWWHYFEAVRPREKPMAETPRGKKPSRDRVLEWARGSEKLVALTSQGGDPRESPLKGWTVKTVRRVLPLIRQAKERWAATSQVADAAS